MANNERMKAQRKELLSALKDYLAEARDNANEWQNKSERSWDMIHGRINWAHKKKTQSKVHINRVGLAQEQIKAQIKQGLVNFDEWLSVETEAGFESELMDTGEAKRTVMRALRRTNVKAKLSKNVGIAAVENLLATKLQPIIIEKRGPGGSKKKEFHIEHIILNIKSYYPDASMGGLYEIHEASMDKYLVIKDSAAEPTDEKPYRKEIAEKLQPMERQEKDQDQDDKGNDRMPTSIARRKQVVLHEFWCTVLDNNGKIMEWTSEDGSKLKLEKIICTMANESEILSDPKPFTTWDGESAFIATTLLNTNINWYGRALLAPGVDMNRAEDELLNAGVDAALKEAYNVNTLKIHGLAKRSQASGGIKYGDTLLQNNQLAPGEKLIDTVRTGQVPPGLLSILSIVKSAGNENMRLNDIAISGNLPSKQTRATEIVAAEQTIQGLFESIVGDLEDVYVEKYAKKSFNMMLQHKKLLSDEDLQYIFYGDEQRIEAFKSKTPRQIFEELGHSFRFKGKGIRGLAANARIAQALINITTAIISNPLIGEAFERRGLDLTKMFDDIIKGLGLDMNKYLSEQTARFAEERALVREETMMKGLVEGQQPQQPQGQVQAPATEAQTGVEPGSGAGSTF